MLKLIDKCLNIAVSEYFPNDALELRIKEQIMYKTKRPANSYFDSYHMVAKIFENAFISYKALNNIVYNKTNRTNRQTPKY